MGFGKDADMWWSYLVRNTNVYSVALFTTEKKKWANI